VARIGLLGGTFNPPHLGHLLCAQEARIGLGLDRVDLLPSGVPPHKKVDPEPGVEHRAAMCALAVLGDPGIGVNLLEADSTTPSFTVDTLRTLHGQGDELTFIVGGDMADSLPTWREPETILGLATLGVAERDEHRRDALMERLERYPSDRIRFFAMPPMGISSTLVRRRAADGRSLRYLVPDGVAAYIERERLYTA
jgi:nicotinate-nucleotide adenylyltransferase